MEPMSLLWLFSESTASQPGTPPAFTIVPQQSITHCLGFLDSLFASEALPNKMYERLQDSKGMCVSHTPWTVRGKGAKQSTIKKPGK